MRCRSCGAELPASGTYCYQCGLSEHEATYEVRSGETAGLRWRAILVGALVALGVSFLLGALYGIFMDPYTSIEGLLVVLLALAAISYFVGGLVAGAVAGYRGALHGMLAAVIAVGVGTIISFFVGTVGYL